MVKKFIQSASMYLTICFKKVKNGIELHCFEYKNLKNTMLFNTVGYFSFLFFMIYTIFVYFYKIKLFPFPGGDETALLNIPYRAVTYGDIQFPVYYPSTAYDIGFLRGVPPITTLFFRTLYHLVFGFSAELSRFFSAGLMLFSTVFVLAFCKSNYPKLSSWKLSLIAVVIGLTPAMILSARSMRIEQEVLFWGVVGTFGLFVFLPKVKSKCSLWFFAGICLGLAATSHPWGIVLPCVILVSFLLHPKEWYGFDHLTFKQRIFSWGGGILVFSFITIVDFLYKFDEILTYFEGMKSFTIIRNQTFIELFSRNYSGVFHQWLPAKIKAFLYQVSRYSFSTEFLPNFINYYIIFIWVSILLSILFLFLILSKRNKPNILPLFISCYVSIGYLIMSFFYQPNQTYYIYLAFFFSTFLCIVYCHFSFYKDKINIFLSVFLFFTKANLYLLFFFNILFSLYFIRDLLPINQTNHVSLDRVYKNIQKIRADLSLSTINKTEILIDPYTWPFAGKNTGSWIATIAGLPSHEPIAAAFTGSTIDFFINVAPTITPIQVPENIKRNNFQKALKNLNLKAILVILPFKSDYYFYVKPELEGNRINLWIMKNDLETQHFRSDSLFPNILLNESVSSNLSNWNIQQDGYHLLVLNSITKGLNQKQIRFFQGGSEMIPELQSQITKDAPIFYFLKLKRGSFQMHGILPDQVITFDHLSLKNPS